MWYLTEVKPKREQTIAPKYWLGGVCGRGRTIGRKHVDIRMKASSVSRKHADIVVNRAAFYTPTANKRQKTYVSVVDSSAYGTFLKYHPSETPRHVNPDGHHKRLDKDTPTDIYEGAMLAFGAPTVWWRLCWTPVVIACSRLNTEQGQRIHQIAAATALEISEELDTDVTHFIVAEVIPNSVRFLNALCTQRWIVTPAWVEAVHSVVSRACNAIAEAATKDAAAKATELPDESAFLPPFTQSQKDFYLMNDSTCIFAKELANARKGLFKNMLFVFPREERRAKYAALIELLDGKCIIQPALNGYKMEQQMQVIHIQDSGSMNTMNKQRGRDRFAFSENVMITAILKADCAGFQVNLEELEAQIPLENTDVGTPGPLDVESEADSDVSDGTNVQSHDKVQLSDTKEKKEFGLATAEIVSTMIQQNECEKDHLSTSKVDNNGSVYHTAAIHVNQGKKRVRSGSIEPINVDLNDTGIEKTDQINKNDGQEKDEQMKMNPPSNEANNSPNQPCEQDEDMIHQRQFFSVQRGESTTQAIETKATDVRKFHLRKLPPVSIIPLKKLKYNAELDDFPVLKPVSVKQPPSSDRSNQQSDTEK